MSLRRKLTLFFIAAVVVPVTLLAILLIRVSGESSQKEADARLAASLDTAEAVYGQAMRVAPGEADRISQEVAPALRSGNEKRLRSIAQREMRSPVIAQVTILGADGSVLAQAGPDRSLASSSDPVRGDGKVVGRVRVTILITDRFLHRVGTLTSRDAALVNDQDVLSSTIPLEREQIPADASEPFDLETQGGTVRAASVPLAGSQGSQLVLVAPSRSEFVASVPALTAVLVLIVFLIAALLLIVLLLRNLRERIAVMLAAARRIGSGNFGEPIPVEGSDEMAGLAREINRMSEQLNSQLTELHLQRRQLDESVRRLGDAFAAGLDRVALLETAIETVAAACNADCGRVVLRKGGEDGDVLTTGPIPDDLASVLAEAGDAALELKGTASADSDDSHALAQAMTDGEGSDPILCTMAVARSGAPFTAAEAQILTYLISQTKISIENAELHELVAQQAVTDDLTGISNHRHFSEWIESEAARLQRYDGQLSLVLLDIDNFKRVNDTYGHLEGDRVLRSLAEVLREESREVDEVARFGGEEFVIALPGTPREGAIEVGERLRRKIEATRVVAESNGDRIEVTVSLGVATAPADGSVGRDLIAAADRALYEAKRLGKNRVEASPAARDPDPQGN
jgi:diguanylate cyclase (GGDEF)-like protein